MIRKSLICQIMLSARLPRPGVFGISNMELIRDGIVLLQSRELRDIVNLIIGGVYLSILTMIPMEKSEFWILPLFHLKMNKLVLL